MAGNGKNDCRDHRADFADAEKGYGGDEIDKGRHGLHDVEQRHDADTDGFTYSGQNAEADADERGQHRRGQYQCKRDDGGCPEADIPKQSESEADA